MRDLKINCPHCNQSLEAPEDMLGETIKCPACNGSIELPKPDPQPEPEQPAFPTPQPMLAPEPDAPPKQETKACPYCGEEILAKAKKCKHCGEFIDASLKKQREKQSPISRSTAEAAQRKLEKEKTEYQSHPLMFRNNPIGFILALILILAYGLGLLILLIWWLKCLGTTLTITNKKTILRKGILSKHTNEVYHSDVRNVQVSQSLFNRMFGVGTIGISSAGQADVEIKVAGIPRPVKVKDIIDKHRRD